MIVKLIWKWYTNYAENETFKKIFFFKCRAFVFTMYVSSEFQ